MHNMQNYCQKLFAGIYLDYLKVFYVSFNVNHLETMAGW